MSFKSQKEMLEAIVQHKKIRHKNWRQGIFMTLSMATGKLINQEGEQSIFHIDRFCDYEIYQEPKPKRKITMYRYTYDDSGTIQQSWWIASSFEEYRVMPNRKLLMTESKEIEIEVDA